MSFSSRPSDKFANVFDRSPYNAADPIVKIQHSKGNIVFGRSLVGDDFDQLIYIGKIYENTAGRNVESDAWLDITFPHVVYITGDGEAERASTLG